MAKSPIAKDAFTLLEVMLSVMILSVVLTAMLQMYANNTHTLSYVKKQNKLYPYSSFLLDNANYGKENISLAMYDLVRDFALDDATRRRLKAMKIQVKYTQKEQIDLASLEMLQEQESADMFLKLGVSRLVYEGISSPLLRVGL